MSIVRAQAIVAICVNESATNKHNSQNFTPIETKTCICNVKIIITTNHSEEIDCLNSWFDLK